MALVDGALRLAIGSDPFVLLACALAVEDRTRAAAAAAAEQSDPVLVQALLKLASDSEIEVRHELGYNLKNWTNWVEMDPAVEKLLTDAERQPASERRLGRRAAVRLSPILLKRLHD